MLFLETLTFIMGLTDGGHVAGVSSLYGQYAFTHEVQNFHAETGQTDSIQSGYAFRPTKHLRLIPAFKFGLEQHPASELYDSRYGIATPKLTLVSMDDYAPFFSIDFGKAFYSLSNEKQGKDRKGFTKQAKFTFGFYIKP